MRGEGELGANAIGTEMRQQVSTIEVWCELFEKEASTIRKIDSHEIGGIMRKIEGWENTNSRVYLPIYGRQRAFIRKSVA
ncbi:hypothetical protein LGK97_01695 [Clostridium sp. CS001]|uniref:hypothetical protein n=1 Tax=Clostridium sp. CS001 TaxID=2880648 RepID=UPI001CF32039|nr:hypothetical protein [Clostridium sp. CS001]MCB2288481.1 hypothetical protein [Clostridium sp. CS001]